MDGLEALTTQDYQIIRQYHDPARGNVIYLYPKKVVEATGSYHAPVCCDVKYTDRTIPETVRPGGLSDGPTIKVQASIIQNNVPRLLIEDHYTPAAMEFMLLQQDEYKNKFNVDAAAILGPNPFIDKIFKLGRVASKLVFAENTYIKIGGGVAKSLVDDAVGAADNVAVTGKNIIHHIASNKHLSNYTPKFESIANKYGLKLDAPWNKVDISDAFHFSKHPNQYHEFVLNGMKAADAEAAGNSTKFLQLFDQYVKQPLLNNPNMLNKTGWK